MNAPPADSLVFGGRRQRRQYPVRDEAGALLALVALTWHGSGFTATTPDGATLCTGALARRGLSSTWVVTGADGQTLLTARWRWTGTAARITLPNDEQLELRTPTWKPGFTVSRSDATQVAHAEPHTRRRPRLTRRDYLLQQPEPTLTLAQRIALFYLWRMNEDAAALAA